MDGPGPHYFPVETGRAEGLGSNVAETALYSELPACVGDGYLAGAGQKYPSQPIEDKFMVL